MSLSEDRRFGSWKEIATFLDRDIRTVWRWEKERGLPVHRVPGGRPASGLCLPNGNRSLADSAEHLAGEANRH